MIWYSNPNVVAPAAAVATGLFAFDDTSAGAFAIPLSPVVTPTQAIFNAREVSGVGDRAFVFAVGNAPMPMSVFDSTGARVISVDITSLGAGVINGTVTANGLNPGDVATLRAAAFV